MSGQFLLLRTPIFLYPKTFTVKTDTGYSEDGSNWFLRNIVYHL